MATAVAETPPHASPPVSLGSARTWAKDFMVFGACAGLVSGAAKALTLDGAATGPLFRGGVLVASALLVALQGVLAGSATGISLRVLRGRVPAAAGVALATLAALLATSLPGFLFGRSLLTVDRIVAGLPLTLGVIGLIPWASVQHARGHSTWQVMAATGLFVGAFLPIFARF